MQAILAVFVDLAAEKVTPPTLWAMLAIVTVAAVCPFFEHDWRHRQVILHHLHLDQKKLEKGCKISSNLCRTETILHMQAAA